MPALDRLCNYTALVAPPAAPQWKRHEGDPPIGTLRDAVAFNLALSQNDPARGIAMATPYAVEADAWALRKPDMWTLHASGLLHQTLGRIRRNAGELDLALRQLDAAIEIFDHLAKICKQTTVKAMVMDTVGLDQAYHMTAITQLARAGVFLDEGRAPESLAAVEEVGRFEQRALDLDPNSPAAVRTLNVIHGQRSVLLLETGKRERAVAEARIELEKATDFLKKDDSNATAQRDMSQAERHLGNALGDAVLLHAAAGKIAELADADPAFLLNRVLQAGTLNEYALALLKSGDRGGSTAAFNQALLIAGDVLREAPTWADSLRERAMAESGLARSGATGMTVACLADWAELRRRSPLRNRPGDARGACPQIAPGQTEEKTGDVTITQSSPAIRKNTGKSVVPLLQFHRRVQAQYER